MYRLLIFFILLSNGLSAQSSGEVSVKMYGKKIEYLQRIIKTEYKYQHKIHKLLVKKSGGVPLLSSEDSLSIYRNSSTYRTIDSMEIIYHAFFKDAPESPELRSGLDALEASALNTAVIKHINMALYEKKAVYSKKVLRKVDVYKQRSGYLSSLFPDIAISDILPLKKYSGIFEKLGSKSISMHNFTSVEELEKMGIQTKRRVSDKLDESGGNLTGAFEQNIQKNLEEYLPENYGRYIEEAKGVRDVWHDLKSNGVSKGKYSYKIKPFSHRFSFNTSVSFRRTNDNKGSLLNGEGNIFYNVSDYFYFGAGSLLEVHVGHDVRNLKLQHNSLLISGSAGVNVFDFYSQLTYQRPMFIYQLNEGVRTGEEQLFLGIGKRFRINDQYYYNIYWGYDLLWKNLYNVSPFIFKFGLTRV